MKICIICGDEFQPKTSAQRVCSKQHYRPCPTCGKMLSFRRPSDPIKFCSKPCRVENTKKRNLEKYGVEHPMQCAEVKEHYRAAMIDKYGVDSPLKSEEIKQRAVATNLERFGAEWALGSEEVHDKIKCTMVEKYGVEYSFQSESIRQKSIQSCIDRYGVKNAMQNPEIRRKANETTIRRYGVSNSMKIPEVVERAKRTKSLRLGVNWAHKIHEKAMQTLYENYGVTNPSFSKEVVGKIGKTMMDRYGVKSPIMVPEFRDKMVNTNQKRFGAPYYVLSDTYVHSCGHIRISDINRRFANLLDAHNIRYSFEHTIGLKAYDIFIPDRNTLIEIDPTYTHNSIGNHWNKSGVHPNYHRDKTSVAVESGYRCIHIFDWDDKFSILNLVLHRERIYARQCEIREVSKSDIEAFTDEYHIQGSCRGQRVNYGLFYNDELIQVMSFGTPRYNRNYQWELLRLCTVTGYYVVGGAERLFRRFITDVDPDSIISYCDKAKFSGDVYTRLGFTHAYDTAPTKIWSKGAAHITNNLLLQRGYDQLFNTDYGKGTSNEDLMLQNGWLPVYDCGQGVYTWNK